MNATVAQIIAATPMPTPMPAFAPALKPDEEGNGFKLCFAAGDAGVEDVFPNPVEEVGLDECAAAVGTGLLCAACNSTDGVAEAPGMVYPA